jgi:hypothetical protein
MNGNSLQVTSFDGMGCMRELSMEEIVEVSGAVDGMAVASGVAVIAGSVAVVLTAPVTIPTLLVSSIGATAGAWMVGYGVGFFG